MRDLLLASQRLPGAMDATLDLLHSLIRPWRVRPEARLREEELASLDLPVQFVWGTRDRFGPVTVGREATRILPDAALQAIPGGGHVPWIGHPEEVGRVCRSFLERVVAEMPIGSPV